MDPIIIAGGLVFLVTAGVAAAVKHYQNKVAKTNAELEKLATALSQYAKAYQFEECDQPVIAAVKQYIITLRAHGNMAAIMESMDVNDRKDYMRKVVREIARIIDIELSDINITDLGLYTFGQSYIDNGKYKIDLNEALLIADPDRLLKTVCHELRHLQQIQALTYDKWGFSDHRKAQWMMAFHYYVDMEEHTEMQYTAYVLQSVEIDANKFADEVTADN